MKRYFAQPGVDYKKLGIVFGALALFLVFSLVSIRFAPQPPKLMADMSPRCANTKLPSYFVSDPHVVRKLGGKALLYVEGSNEEFGLGTPSPAASGGDGSAPAAAVAAASAEPTGGAYGHGTIGMTTVERPDSGTLLLAVAQDEPDRELGLMCVTKMAPRVGMIFVFTHDGIENFWMKDTLIPLDMIFVSDDGRVTGVAANVPSSRLDESDRVVARRSGRGRYVIELNAGEAAADDIRAGAVLRISRLDATD